MDTEKTNPGDSYRVYAEELLKVISELKFIVAHNVRAPIASASGLVILLGAEECAKEDREKIIRYLASTLYDMDVHTRQIMVALLEMEKTFCDKPGEGAGGISPPGVR